MKKVIFLLIISIVLYITGCSNFLNGNILKAEIEKEIKIANASKIQVFASSVNPESGVLTQEGYVEVKEGINFQLNFAEREDYKFVRWMAFSRDSIQKFLKKNKPSSFTYKTVCDDVTKNLIFDGLILDENTVKIESPEENITKVTVFDGSTEIILVPVCYRRPHLVSWSCENESALYPRDTRIVLTFSDVLSDEIIIKKPVFTPTNLVSTKYSGCLIYKKEADRNFLNPDFINITFSNSKTSAESTDATFFYTAELNKKDLILTPIITYNASECICKTDIWESGLDWDGVNLEGHIRENENIIYPIGMFTSLTDTPAVRRYVQIDINADVKDINKTELNKKLELPVMQSQVSDKEPPLLVNIEFYLPDNCFNLKDNTKSTNGAVVYDGSVNYSANKYPSYARYFFDKNIIYNGTGKDWYKNVATMADKCRRLYDNPDEYGSWRVKNDLVYYVEAIDIISADNSAMNVANVKDIICTLDRLSDNQGNLNEDFTNLGPDYSYHPYVNYKYNTGYNDRIEERTGLNFQSIVDKKGGMATYMDLKENPDGLYVLHVYGEDISENKGINRVDREALDELKIDTKIAKNYVGQLWFVKDTVAPETTAEDFYPVKSLASTANPANPDKIIFTELDEYQKMYIPYDGTYLLDPARKIVDAGSYPYNAIHTYRICKVLSEEDAENWKVTGLEDEWRITYGNDADYNFEEIWGKDFLPKDFDPDNEKFAVYAYVKDDVNNISSIIKLPLPEYSPFKVTEPCSVRTVSGRGTVIDINGIEARAGLVSAEVEITSNGQAVKITGFTCNNRNIDLPASNLFELPSPYVKSATLSFLLRGVAINDQITFKAVLKDANGFTKEVFYSQD